MQEHSAPSTWLGWLQSVSSAMQWPLLVAAFVLGRYVKTLEVRVSNAERNLKDLIERHLPHVHRALAEIKGKLETVQALMQKKG